MAVIPGFNYSQGASGGSLYNQKMGQQLQAVMQQRQLDSRRKQQGLENMLQGLGTVQNQLNFNKQFNFAKNKYTNDQLDLFEDRRLNEQQLQRANMNEALRIMREGKEYEDKQRHQQEQLKLERDKMAQDERFHQNEIRAKHPAPAGGMIGNLINTFKPIGGMIKERADAGMKIADALRLHEGKQRIDRKFKTPLNPNADALDVLLGALGGRTQERAKAGEPLNKLATWYDNQAGALRKRYAPPIAPQQADPFALLTGDSTQALLESLNEPAAEDVREIEGALAGVAPEQQRAILQSALSDPALIDPALRSYLQRRLAELGR